MRVQKKKEKKKGKKGRKKEKKKKMKERAVFERSRPEGVCLCFYAAKINATRREEGGKQREDAWS